MNKYTVKIDHEFFVIVEANTEEEAKDFVGNHSLPEMYQHMTGEDLEIEIEGVEEDSPRWVS